MVAGIALAPVGVGRVDTLAVAADVGTHGTLVKTQPARQGAQTPVLSCKNKVTSMLQKQIHSNMLNGNATDIICQNHLSNTPPNFGVGNWVFELLV